MIKITDALRNLFVKQKTPKVSAKTPEITKLEKELMESLEDIAKTAPKDAGYTPKSEDELKEIAQNTVRPEFETKLASAEEKYVGTLKKLDAGAEELEEASLKAAADLDERYKKELDGAREYALKAGLQNSSIKTETEKGLSRARHALLAELSAENLEKAYELADKKASAKTLRDKTVKSLSADYAAGLEKALAAAKKAEKSALTDALDKKETEETEETYGYIGEKLANYQERLNAALSLYSALPKAQALELVRENTELREYLGAMYGKLIEKISL